VVPVIRALKAYGDEIRDAELERLFRRLPNLTARDREMIRAAAGVIVNRLLHHPVIFLKSAASEEDGSRPVHVDLLRNLFGLESREGAAPAPPAPNGRR
jgi:glutamyl-tRNA reductase